jgi:3-hydroxy-9,10-secoandrosta-1,3,5(10)-triene-9,17-dione monooxygenase
VPAGVSSLRSADPPLEGLLERVRSVTPLIRDRALEAERRRKPDDEVIEALKATGVFRAFVPKRFGGYEIGLDLFVDLGVCISEACASTGWITTFYMEHNWLLTGFCDQLQQEVFGQQPFVLAPGSVNPKAGEAVPKDGGYELTGRWKFGTGIMHADWVLLNAGVVSAEAPTARMFLVRPEQIEVIDTWHVDGMVATGSHDIVAKAIYVPEKNASLPLGAARAGEASYLTRIPVPPFLALTAAIPAVGAARRAAELFRQLVGERVRFGTQRVQAESGAAQIRLAGAYARTRSAETVLRDCARAIEAHGRGETESSPLEQTQVRLAIAHVVHDCLDAVRRIMDGSGASVHFLDHELQRIHRDVQMMSAHTIFDLELVGKQCGHAMLEAKAPLFAGP